MKKVLIAVATAFIALTSMFSTPADAGFKVRIGFGLMSPRLVVPLKPRRPVYRKYKKRKYQAAKRRRAKRKTYAKKRSRKPATIAKVKTTPKAAPVAKTFENQNSTISTAMVETTENTTETTPEEVETVAENSGEVTSIADTGNQLGCKKFFPAVGMTLSVPCE